MNLAPQNDAEERFSEFPDRIRISDAISVHLQSELLELFLHDGSRCGVGYQRKKLKAVTLVML